MKPTESAAPASRLQRLARARAARDQCGAAVCRSPLVSSATGVYRTLSDGHALFPGGAVGWSLAVLTGIIVGHLVALGRDRWWGGTGSGAALTLAVLLLYGWVPAGLVSLAVVVLVGAARRHRWRQAAAARRGGHPRHRRGGPRSSPRSATRPSVEHALGPADLGHRRRPGGRRSPPPPTSPSPAPCCGTPSPRAAAGCRPSPAPPLLRQGLVGVALLGIAPLICVVATATPRAAAAVRGPAHRPGLHPVDRPRPRRGAAARPADRPAQPPVAAGAHLDRAGRRRARRRPIGARPDRPRPVPLRQRHPRPPRRRPAAAADRRPAAARPAARRGGRAARRRRVRRAAARRRLHRPAPSASPAISSPPSARRWTSTG